MATVFGKRKLHESIVTLPDTSGHCYYYYSRMPGLLYSGTIARVKFCFVIHVFHYHGKSLYCLAVDAAVPLASLLKVPNTYGKEMLTSTENNLINLCNMSCPLPEGSLSKQNIGHLEGSVGRSRCSARFCTKI